MSDPLEYDIALNQKTHDLAIDNSDPSGMIDLLLISNAEGVAQEIKMSLLFFYQEWFLDTTKGVPYLTDIFIKNPDLSTIRSILTATIAAVPHVIAVNYLNLSPLTDSRQMVVTWGAATDYGYVERSTILTGASQNANQ